MKTPKSRITKSEKLQRLQAKIQRRTGLTPEAVRAALPNYVPRPATVSRDPLI